MSIILVISTMQAYVLLYIEIMEGPSLVIAKEEFAKFKGKRVKDIEGNAKIGKERLRGSTFKRALSWGKHFILVFEKGSGKAKQELIFRIHFLMFGSYRINKPRENRFPRLAFSIGSDRIFLYSCGIKELTKAELRKYDWSIDLMSPRWDHKQAVAEVKNKPDEMVCDILMDQGIFSGLGNIIKNEVQYRLRLHPEKRIKNLSSKKIDQLVFEAWNYSHQFYEWKKINQLKKHWLIMRKKECPKGHGKVIKEPTGKLQRLSHYCPICQPLETRLRKRSPRKLAEKRLTSKEASLAT